MSMLLEDDEDLDVEMADVIDAWLISQGFEVE